MSSTTPPAVPDTAETISTEQLEQLLDGELETMLHEQLLPVLQELLQAAAAPVVMILVTLASMTLALALANNVMTRKAGARDPGGEWVAAGLCCIALYLLGRALDPLLVTLLERPEWFPAERFDRIGWFEWRLLGRPIAWAVLPLADHLAVALVVHAVFWVFTLVLVRTMFAWAYDLRRIAFDDASVPWFFRWVGSSTARRPDRKFRRWIGRALPLLMTIHVLAGLRMAAEPAEGPAAGTWVVGGVLLWLTSFHLLTSGRPPQAPKKEEDEDEDAEAAEAAASHATPLQRLERAVDALRPGTTLEALEDREAHAAHTAEFPARAAPLVREIFEETTGATRLWSHQVAVLEHLTDVWSMRSSTARSDVPRLEEEKALGPIAVRGAVTPHALVLSPEGSGRTTLTVLAALHVFVDRGATSLVVVRDREAAATWAGSVKAALTSSSARWNVLVARAGDDMTSLLVAGRMPSIVVAALQDLESEVLVDRRTDAFLGRLGLVIADDLDAFTGIAEMHLQMCMRRLWALLDSLHTAAYPAALVATAAAGASGMDTWAKHVLAVPLRVFDDDGAPCRSRVLLRRRDLVDGRGDDVPLQVLAEACEKAELPWHRRLCGDAHRPVRRAMFDLGTSRRHHRDDPADAAVVLIEGTYPDVRREADRLAHAGRNVNAGGVVLVLAPPADEEMVLHEEADDAAHRELVTTLPLAVPLSEPRLIAQRHFDRALSREQALEALGERFGTRFVKETVERLLQHGKVVERKVPVIDPHTDDIIERVLVSSARQGALGRPIEPSCVSEPSARTTISDAGTSEPLMVVDRAVASAVVPPGTVFLHRRGRFRVLDRSDAESSASEGTGDELTAEPVGKAVRTTVDRTVALPGTVDLVFSERKLGGCALRVALGHARVQESVHGVRTYGPGPRLLDERLYDTPVVSSYGTEVCLVSVTIDGSTPGVTGLSPMVAALRMMLPCYLRACHDLADVDLVEHEGETYLCFFDRVPGGAGFSRFIGGRGLLELFTMTRLALERLVGPELLRLRAIHDHTPGADPNLWDLAEALRFLDEVLDTPAAPETADADTTRAVRSGPRAEFTPGAGRGALGRLWISTTGRTDDLVWTRHRFVSRETRGDIPPGPVFFDLAFERHTIIAARRRAALPSGDVWLELGSAGRVLHGDRDQLVEVRKALSRVADHVDTVLALVAAIPRSVQPLAVPDRNPIVVLARRRADASAKALLAAALLPDDIELRLLAPARSSAAGEVWLGLVHAGRSRVVDLRGPTLIDLPTDTPTVEL
jgi:hypothetical protein